jgi:hypothetical protein
MTKKNSTTKKRAEDGSEGGFELGIWSRNWETWPTPASSYPEPARSTGPIRSSREFTGSP